MQALRNPAYIFQPKIAIESRLNTMEYVARPTNRDATMKGVWVDDSVMFGIAQSA